ncbi:aspartate aminotransferase family protein [Fodinibius salsisoli]|uniref:Aspartate aminotransferase family protein n=1 Tax=Fodinibius salsisoli TaxID=2820877 RepID=A0ABT3PL48_9BACT|nr:aspartate aminotransferase family protein [Fodinibius salsisoli]MCW9706617.1 aspartate aminotransferase family protein [Fodinibius salsisoli]
MDAQQITEKYHLPVYNRYPITLVKGRGSKVWDEAGNEYLDVLAGIAVNSLGHCHPKVVETIQKQSRELMHISNFYYSKPQAQLLQLLSDISGMSHGFLCNSGAEAMEACLKAARRFGVQNKKNGPLITVSNAFHGRTMATISMGMPKYAKNYDPLLNGFSEVPFNDIDALKSVFTDQTLGIVLETVQGSGGLQVASEEYMQEIQQLCEKHKALFIVDEVQTGMGRTGKMFSFEHYDIEPDIIAIAKAMGGGFPIGGMLCQPHVADAMEFGAHGSTYGGNPLACATSHTAINVIKDEKLVQAAAQKGAFFVELLTELTEDLSCVSDIRGKGLMIGVELSFEGRPVVEEMMKQSVLSNCTSGNVIRLVPPLVISHKELEQAAEVLVSSIKKTAPSKTTN